MSVLIRHSGRILRKKIHRDLTNLVGIILPHIKLKEAGAIAETALARMEKEIEESLIHATTTEE